MNANVIKECPYCGVMVKDSDEYCSLCNMPLKPEEIRQVEETQNHNARAKQSSQQTPRQHRTYGQKAIIAGVIFMLVGFASMQQKNSSTSFVAGLIQAGALFYMLYCGVAGFIKGFRSGVGGS